MGLPLRMRRRCPLACADRPTPDPVFHSARHIQAIVPSWPAYNQHKVSWLPPLTEDGQLKPPGEELSFELKKDR